MSNITKHVHHRVYGRHLPDSWLTQRYFNRYKQLYFICTLYAAYSNHPRIIEALGCRLDLTDEYDRPSAIRWFIYRNVER